MMKAITGNMLALHVIYLGIYGSSIGIDGMFLAVMASFFFLIYYSIANWEYL